ncbi:leucine-rich repeat domain-containing protein [Prevotella sp. OH937_COT-195]|uniref:leucine-rich repeat domain-containing protein n=1 Tax=Prevotella sp. OH937_COT-195 TaxID=2491051 RepID=UPI000F64D7BB|nr:leucine-rich repeat domain-containing protein [Prevotella sp. OH937_COT-195]RRC97148.1 leucine-rich repeat domain-containing protein [Prevotella sp. OH937_COT-195]
MSNSKFRRTTLIAVLLAITFSVKAQTTPQVLFKFANKAGYEFKILLFGAEKGEATIDWGTGEPQTIQLDDLNGTVVEGTTLSKELTIKGNIASIDCSGNDLLDVNVTALPELKTFVSRKNYVTNYDFSKNDKLQILCIENTPLQKIDLSKNNMIKQVMLANNSIAELIMPEDASRLELMDCSGNYKLQNIDFSTCVNIIQINLLQTSVTKLPLSKLTKMKVFSAGLARPITLIELPENGSLEKLYIPAAGLTSINLSNCEKLTELVLSNNWGLANIDCTKLTELKVLDCIGTAIEGIDLGKCAKLEELKCNNCNIKSLDVSNNPKLKVLDCFVNQIEELLLENTQLENLDCSGNENLSKLTLPATLKDLDCSACKLEEINIKTPEIMESLVCGKNNIRVLDVSRMSSLASLTCNENKIEELDTKELTSLLNINVEANPLTSLDLGGSPSISYVKINNTELNATALDNLYRSLRRIPRESLETGVYYLLNDVAEASMSATSIATEKGWTVSTTGSGTDAVENISEDKTLLNITANGKGWIMTGLPSNARSICLYDTVGRLVGSFNIVSRTATIPASVQNGVYVIRANGMSHTVILK